MPKKPVSLLRLLSYNENKLRTLYLLYADAFPACDSFWRKIASEEKNHAESLQTLSDKFGPGKEFTKISPYGIKILYNIRRLVAAKIRTANKTALHHALTTALRLELSMIEKKYFEMFTPAEAEIEAVLKRLNRETTKHAIWLQKKIVSVDLGAKKSI